jgi:hypothetical protein
LKERERIVNRKVKGLHLEEIASAEASSKAGGEIRRDTLDELFPVLRAGSTALLLLDDPPTDAPVRRRDSIGRAAARTRIREDLGFKPKFPRLADAIAAGA